MNRPAGTAYDHKPRGSWKVNRIYANLGAPRVPQNDDTVVYVEFDVAEPLLLSPFVFGSGYGKQGFYGIQAMHFQMIMTGNANRAWRCALFPGQGGNPAYKTAAVDSSLPVHDAARVRHAGPTERGPVLRGASFQDLRQPGAPRQRGKGTGIGYRYLFLSPEVRVVRSSNIQLNGIPDKLIICVRKVVANLGRHKTDSYPTIKGISINYNNKVGLLSSMSPEQLFRNSVQTGLANMCWDELCGSMVSCCGRRPAAAADAGTATTRSAYNGVGSNLSGGRANPGVQYAPTNGTILVLNFAEVIQLTEE